MHDLELISGRFQDGEVPNGKEYLLHYFTTPPQRLFIGYYFCFPGFLSNIRLLHRMFGQHSGLVLSTRRIYYWVERVQRLEAAVKYSSENCDLTLLHAIKSGKLTDKQIQSLPCQKQP